MTARADLSNAQVSRLKDLFERAVNTPAEGRQALLNGARTDDPALAGELESLLDAHDRSSGYFERLAEETIARAVSTIDEDDPETLPAAGLSVLHYELIERIGGGGMGVVYKARDTRLNRIVALKFLPRRHSALPGARARLLAEARAASALDNPNIGVVYEIADAEDGRPFIAMAWYDGETLKSLSRRERLPVREAVSIARQLANALAAAHAAGIIHRDLKPANVIVTRSGTAKLVDFGIAKLASVEDGQLDRAAGTVAYMSPEQTRGITVDGRSDIWSLGVLLYEILAGHRPFQGTTDSEVIEAIRDALPPAVTESRPDVPPGIVHVIAKCLEKNPGMRYQSAAEVEAALAAWRSEAVVASRVLHGRGMTIGAVAAALVTIAGAVWGYSRITREDRSAGSPDAMAATVSVLPFINGAGSDSTEYMLVGIADDIRTELARIPSLTVSSRDATETYAPGGQPLRVAARELGANYVVIGELIRPSGQPKLQVSLIDGLKGGPLWTDVFDGRKESAPRIARAAAEGILDRLSIPITPDERLRLDRPPTASVLAYDFYLRGRYAELSAAPKTMVGRTAPDLVRRAQALYAQVRALDPNFGVARARLAVTHMFSATAYDTTRARREQARVDAEAALRLDSSTAEAFSALAAYRARNGQPDSAISLLLRGLQLAPNHIGLTLELGDGYIAAGRWEDGIAQYEKAMRLDPRNPRAYWSAAMAFGRLRRQDRGMLAFAKLLEIRPEDHEVRLIRGQSWLRWKGTGDTLLAAAAGVPKGWDNRGMATFARFTGLMVQRRYREILTMLDSSRSEVSEDGLVYHPKSLMRAEAYRGLGRLSDARRHYELARQLLEDSVAANPGNAAMHSALGLAYAGLGRKREAMREAEKAMQLVPFSANAMRGTAYMGLAAETYARTGELDRAFQMIELMLTMASGREITVPYLEAWPGFDPLRRDPRFDELRARFPLRFPA